MGLHRQWVPRPGPRGPVPGGCRALAHPLVPHHLYWAGQHPLLRSRHVALPLSFGRLVGSVFTGSVRRCRGVAGGTWVPRSDAGTATASASATAFCSVCCERFCPSRLSSSASSCLRLGRLPWSSSAMDTPVVWVAYPCCPRFLPPGRSLGPVAAAVHGPSRPCPFR